MTLSPRKTNVLLWAVLFLNLLILMLTAMGVVGNNLVIVGLVINALLLLVLPVSAGLRLLVLLVPFYTVVALPSLPELPSWRILFALFAIRFLLSREVRASILSFRFQNSLTKVRALQRHEVLLGVLMLFALVSVVYAHFPVHALKQVIFLLNIAVVYVIGRFVFRDQLQRKATLIAVAISSGIVVLLGYVQYIASFFTGTYYFWQYWALFPAKAIYGLDFARVLAYSNSWFSYTGGGQVLRMFSVLPDSHSFALICAVAIAALLPLRALITKRSYRVLLWLMVILSGLGIILSGTRGLWAGLLGPIVLCVIYGMLKVKREVIKQTLVPILLVLIVFACSPIISKGIAYVRSLEAGSILERAESIYDLSESSNAGRLDVWKASAAYAITHPLGTGYGNLLIALVGDVPLDSSYDQIANARNLKFNLPQKFISAHSLYLQVLVELGIGGLLLFLWFAWQVFWTAMRYIKKQENPSDFSTQFVVQALLWFVWILAYSVFDVTIFNDRVLIYTFIIYALFSTIVLERKPLK